PYIDSKIVWGDYESERGLVTGIYHGLLLNTVPIVPPGLREKYPLRVDERGFHFAGGGGGWNTRPSIQYVGKGRRPYGPYGFSLGGSVRLPDGAGTVGEGRFKLRVPADRTRMITTVWNPVAEPLDLEIDVNGARRRQTIAPGTTARIETPLDEETALAVAYRGDRRLVLLETDFR
ncbi:MAG: glycosyl hydrolase family 2, partial [Gemmatimonadetes bacterium]|nr:glycosyl hydrolase family 2 [Gemmatimonadota bacterium]